MEFLMTYGWAILAAVIAIGVLAYFGVFSPGKSLPDICTINAPLGCEEHSVSETLGVRLIIRNGAGNSIDITSLTVGDCTATVPGVVADGATLDTTVLAGCTIGIAGGKYRGDISITYLRTGAQIPQTSTGTINAEIV